MALGAAWLAAVYLLAPIDADVMGPLARRWEGLLLGAGLCLLWVRVLFDPRVRQPVATAAATVLGFACAPFLLAFYLRLAQWGCHEPGAFSPAGVFLAFYVSLTVKLSDVGAYVAGTTLGRHRLFPRVSPGKSWEGLVGGLAVAALASVAVVAAARAWPWVPGGPLAAWSLTRAAVAGVAFGLVGVLGDLTESLVKRAAGVKDSSGFVPGMGGILDVVDSLLFAPLCLDLFLAWTAA
jgi:phosphatidate cytidylyltransferase